MVIGYFFCAYRGTCLVWISLITFTSPAPHSPVSCNLWPLTSCAESFNFNWGTFLHSSSVLLVVRVRLMLASSTVLIYFQTVAPIVNTNNWLLVLCLAASIRCSIAAGHKTSSIYPSLGIQHGKSYHRVVLHVQVKSIIYISSIRIWHGSWIEQIIQSVHWKYITKETNTLRSSSSVPVKSKIQIYIKYIANTRKQSL